MKDNVNEGIEPIFTEDEARECQALAQRGYTIHQLKAKFPQHGEEVIKLMLTYKFATDEQKKAQLRAGDDIAASHGAVNDQMDPLQQLLYDLCHDYNNLGEKLKPLSEILSRNPLPEVIEAHVDEIEKFWHTMQGEKMPLHRFMVMTLQQNFIFVLRPVLVAVKSKGNASASPSGDSKDSGSPTA